MYEAQKKTNEKKLKVCDPGVTWVFIIGVLPPHRLRNLDKSHYLFGSFSFMWSNLCLSVLKKIFFCQDTFVHFVILFVVIFISLFLLLIALHISLIFPPPSPYAPTQVFNTLLPVSMFYAYKYRISSVSLFSFSQPHI